jgi:hypothetical protein
MVNSVRATAGSLFCLAVGVSLLGLVGGCNSGPAKVNVSGTVSKNGQPLKVSKQGVVEIMFVSQGSDTERQKTKTAEADPETGKYQIKGIEVGKYKVTIRQIDPMPTTDLLDGAFNKQNSKILRDVESNDQVIDIDIARDAG